MSPVYTSVYAYNICTKFVYSFHTNVHDHKRLNTDFLTGCLGKEIPTTWLIGLMSGHTWTTSQLIPHLSWTHREFVLVLLQNSIPGRESIFLKGVLNWLLCYLVFIISVPAPQSRNLKRGSAIMSAIEVWCRMTLQTVSRLGIHFWLLKCLLD